MAVRAIESLSETGRPSVFYISAACVHTGKPQNHRSSESDLLHTNHISMNKRQCWIGREIWPTWGVGPAGSSPSPILTHPASCHRQWPPPPALGKQASVLQPGSRMGWWWHPGACTHQWLGKYISKAGRMVNFVISWTGPRSI